jgi:hypothetical protein
MSEALGVGFKAALVGEALANYGTYFISADMPRPMWDATFSSPEEMRRHKAAELRLIERRIADTANGDDTVEALIRKLSQVPTIDQLKFLSSKADIAPNRWSPGGSVGAAAARLVDAAVQMKKQQALLHAVQLLGES